MIITANNEYIAKYKEYDYLFSDIEKDIVYGFIAEENRKHMLATGYRKYYSDWVEEGDDYTGKYMCLYVYEYVVNGKKVEPVLRMKIRPVDKNGKIVQTKEQKKEHERVLRTIDMEDKMIAAGIQIRESRSRKTPNFQPDSEE